jgi:hypothetical protein
MDENIISDVSRRRRGERRGREGRRWRRNMTVWEVNLQQHFCQHWHAQTL